MTIPAPRLSPVASASLVQAEGVALGGGADGVTAHVRNLLRVAGLAAELADAGDRGVDVGRSEIHDDPFALGVRVDSAAVRHLVVAALLEGLERPAEEAAVEAP